MLDFVLEVAWVLLQTLPESGHILTDLQQLHWITIMIPTGCNILTDRVNVIILQVIFLVSVKMFLNVTLTYLVKSPKTNLSISQK